VPVSSTLAFGGIGGLAFGLASKDVVGNFFGGELVVMIVAILVVVVVVVVSVISLLYLQKISSHEALFLFLFPRSHASFYRAFHSG